MRRREFLSLLGGAVAGWPHGTATQPAQNWPQRVVRIVVPFVPGGGTDAIARILAAGLTKSAGYQIVIENKGGQLQYRHRRGRPCGARRLHRAVRLAAVCDQSLSVFDARL